MMKSIFALQGVFAENLLFIRGKTENLPWMDGVIYLGKDSRSRFDFSCRQICSPDIAV